MLMRRDELRPDRQNYFRGFFWFRVPENPGEITQSTRLSGRALLLSLHATFADLIDAVTALAALQPYYLEPRA